MQIQVYLTPKFTLRPQQTHEKKSNMSGSKGRRSGDKQTGMRDPHSPFPFCQLIQSGEGRCQVDPSRSFCRAAEVLSFRLRGGPIRSHFIIPS